MSERKTIYLCLAHMSEDGVEQKYVKEAFDTNWVVPLGPNVNGFEADLESFVGEDKKVVALSAGTAAVHLALLACGVGPGDEVLVQSFTFCASSHPITYLGATPVFVDSEPDTWNMDPDLLEEAIKDRIAKTGMKPKAIVPVALYGMPYDCTRIMVIADRYGIPVVEDAAEGFTLARNQRALKTIKDAGIERVIDLVGYYWYDKNAKEAGLEYYCPKFGRGQLGVWEEEAFVTKGEFIAKETMYYTPNELEKNKKYLENRVKAFEKHSRTSVERFVEYIEVMQKGYYYIGCEYGTYKTDDYLLLNTVFNPKSKEKFIPFGHMFKLDFMKNLYAKLTPEDKKRMGWTKEFDESVPKRLNEAINANVEYHRERDQW